MRMLIQAAVLVAALGILGGCAAGMGVQALGLLPGLPMATNAAIGAWGGDPSMRTPSPSKGAILANCSENANGDMVCKKVKKGL